MTTRSTQPKKISSERSESTEGRDADPAIEAVGYYSLIEDAAKVLAPNGKVGTYGAPPAKAPTLKIDLSSLRRDWTLKSTSPDEPSAHNEILDLVRRGLLTVEKLITHIYPLKEIAKCFQAIKRKEALKVIITM